MKKNIISLKMILIYFYLGEWIWTNKKNIMKVKFKQKKCKFFLATGKNNEEQKILNEIKISDLKNYCQSLDNLS